MPSLSDFDHYKIETDILEDGNEVVSYEYITNVELGLRNAKRERRWYRQGKIGQGSCSDVWLEIQKGDAEAKRAVKAISKRKLLEINVDYARELKALTEFFKPKYRQKGVFVDFSDAMEYFPMGSLEDNISSGLADVEVMDIIVQLLEGLEIMHAEGFAHRDLKPANIFVVRKYPEWWRIQNQDTSLRTFTGTHDYMAPEFFGYVDGIEDESSDYTHAVDIWALGCVVYRLWTRTVPFPANPNLRPLQRYCSGRDTFSVEALTSAGCTDVDIASIKALLRPEPLKRPSAKAALGWEPFVLAKHIREELINPNTIFPQISRRGYSPAESWVWHKSETPAKRSISPSFLPPLPGLDEPPPNFYLPDLPDREITAYPYPTPRHTSIHPSMA